MRVNLVRAAVCVFVAFVFAPAVSGCGKSAPQKTGGLIVRSEPGRGALIILNGREQASRTDATFRDLKSGLYTIELLKPPSAANSATMTGSAEVDVEAGRTTRVIIELSPTAIVPAAAEEVPRPKSRGQKSIFDFYTAVSAGDLDSAYSLLGIDARRSYGWRTGFHKFWEEIDRVEIVELVTESYDPTETVEVNRAVLRIRSSIESGGHTASSLSTIRITTSEEDFGGSGRPLITELRPDSGPPSL